MPIRTLPFLHCNALVSVQSRALTFLTQTMRGYPGGNTKEEAQAHAQAVCSAIFYLFKTAPDSISIRRELLSATRYMLSGEYKQVCFLGVIPDVLQEGVLLGSHSASMETLRPLAVSSGGPSCLIASKPTRVHCNRSFLCPAVLCLMYRC